MKYDIIDRWPKDFELSKEAVNLIEECLNINAIKRIPLEEIISHPFFKKNTIPTTLPSSSL